jgi:hypothetical protein
MANPNEMRVVISSILMKNEAKLMNMAAINRDDPTPPIIDRQLKRSDPVNLTYTVMPIVAAAVTPAAIITLSSLYMAHMEDTV